MTFFFLSDFQTVFTIILAMTKGLSQEKDIWKKKIRICGRPGDLINSYPVDRKQTYFLVLPKEWG